MKLKKGSAEAKRFMASIRAKKKGSKKAPAKKLSGTKKPTMKKAKPSGSHKDIKSHNTRISVISGVKPHKAKYYITYKIDNTNKTEYFDKLPLDRYAGSDRMLYLTRLTDKGTSLIPVKDVKYDLPIKVTFKYK